jgi:prepilin-type N-terminal cleavage/methylation domain-containing protein
MDRKAIIAKKRKDKGFTLIELLIVIAILGILSTIVVLSVRGITDRGQSSACDTDKKSLETAYESAVANGVDFSTASSDVTSTLTTGGYLHSGSAWYQVSNLGTVTAKTGVTACS